MREALMPWSYWLLATVAVVLVAGLLLFVRGHVLQKFQAWRENRELARRLAYVARHSIDIDGDTIALPIPTTGGVR